MALTPEQEAALKSALRSKAPVPPAKSSDTNRVLFMLFIILAGIFWYGIEHSDASRFKDDIVYTHILSCLGTANVLLFICASSAMAVVFALWSIRDVLERRLPEAERKLENPPPSVAPLPVPLPSPPPSIPKTVFVTPQKPPLADGMKVYGAGE